MLKEYLSDNGLIRPPNVAYLLLFYPVPYFNLSHLEKHEQTKNMASLFV